MSELQALSAPSLEPCGERLPRGNTRVGGAMAALLQTGRFRGTSRVVAMEWGVRPSWIDTELSAARAEKYTADRPTWWSGFRRCAVPARGLVLGNGDARLYVDRVDGLLLWVPGLYRVEDLGPGRSYGERGVLLTLPTHSKGAEGLSNRRPALLDAADLGEWLDSTCDRRDLGALLRLPEGFAGVRVRRYTQGIERPNDRGAGPIIPEQIALFG